MIITRPAAPNDMPQIQAVTNAAFATVRDVYRPNPDATPTSENADLDPKTIVALVDDKIVGAVCVYQDAAALNVSQLAVDPKCRRQGVARKLLQSVYDAGKQSGATELRLNTIRETGNVAIFERLGFTVCATAPATWCSSDRFPKLTEVTMTRKFV